LAFATIKPGKYSDEFVRCPFPEKYEPADRQICKFAVNLDH
jgi:hypothetical protein